MVAAYRDAATTATAQTFARSITQALWYQVAVYLLVLVLRLPKVNPRRLAQQLDPGAAAGP